MTGLLAAHSDAVIALSSAVVGAILGVFGSYWLERRRQRRIARAQIVINLRRWMKRTLSQMYDIQTWVGSGGLGGNIYSKLPKFRFEKSLEQVALLEYSMAMKVFKLIHKKDDANAEAENAREYEDDDVALDIFRNRTALVWLRALRIYNETSDRLGWSDRPFSEKDKAMMEEEVERFRKLERERAKSQAEFLKELNTKTIA
jgi:hypothetical protein